MKQFEIKNDFFGGKGLYALHHAHIQLKVSYSDCITLASIKAKLCPLLKGETLDEKSWFFLYLIHGMIFPDEYTSTLPTIFQEHPMFSKVSLTGKVKAKLNHLHQIFSQLLPHIREIDLAQKISFSDLLIADTQFHSRVIESPEGLVMVDFCNHSFTPNCSVSFINDGLILSSDNPLKVGEELTLCYGEKPNEELLFIHGFTVKHNPFDRVVISSLPFTCNAEAKMTSLHSQALVPPAIVLTRGNELDQLSLYILLLCVCEQDDLLLFADGSWKSVWKEDKIMMLRGWVVLLDVIKFQMGETEGYESENDKVLFDGQLEVLQNWGTLLEEKRDVLLDDSDVQEYLN